MARVVIADNFASGRWALMRALGMAAEIQVVGEVLSARRLLPLIERTRPQVVLVSGEMWEGLPPQLIRTIIGQARVQAVVLADLGDRRRHQLANQARTAGAACVLAPIPLPSSPDFAQAARRLRAVVARAAQRPASALASTISAMPDETTGPRWLAPIHGMGQRARVVALASSTGGPRVLQELLTALPANFPLPILAVQHLTKGCMPDFIAALAAHCPLRVKLAEHREPLASRTIYLAPDDYHLGVSRHHTIELADAPAIERFRPSATWLFSSVADRFGADAVAVILSGRGRDGVAGLAAIRRAGGLILAQDEQSSTACGMPRAAAEAGLADLILPPRAITQRLAALT
jgi:two-component system chemotaxis response regulator CheB